MEVRVSYIKEGKNFEEAFDYLVLSDGFQSSLRQSTSIKLQGTACTTPLK